MKELLYDGFIMRMKSELENPMKKRDAVIQKIEELLAEKIYGRNG